ncbi:hypothetical protein Drose_21905 [Dactylosporangium roseum]|uniref:Integral membrane protein n=1 Tax=Dactylosporangium roseum TaxID=47989 RepID=A0ABY5YXE2_9ACTN|nr:DUF1048 domain-containing protein [Dactylosporangium roseum]UWZ33922.1 hypothetical protein Drose_21905 [Dactylosporangium roseum]
MDTIDDAVMIADREWRACGVRRRDRTALAADLRLDLESAAADGVTPRQLIGDDLRGFARRLADEAGVRRAPHEYGRVIRTALTGAVLGGCAGAVVLMIAYPLMVRLVDLPRGFRVPLLLAVLLYYGTAAGLAAGGAVVAVRLRLRDLPGVRRTANAMLVLVPLAGVVVTPVVMRFARSTGYSTAPLVVAAEAGLVVAAVAGAVALARRWSMRGHDGRRAPAAV